MNRERLELARTVLTLHMKNPDTHSIDMSVWGRTDTREPHRLDCSTEACALGTLCISRVFDDAGLSYDIEGGGMISRSRYALYPKWRDPSVTWNYAGDGWKYGLEAAECLFDIDTGAACHLFNPACYNHTKGNAALVEVLEHIEDVLADRKEKWI